MEPIVNVLQKGGLSNNEAKVYAALLHLGSSKAGRISKAAEIDRTSTYNSLKLLIEKGLASFVIMGKIRWFQPAHPSQLLSVIREKEERLKEILPVILQQYREKKPEEEDVKIFKGLAGVRAVLEDVLDHARTNLIFGSEGKLEEHMPYYYRRFVSEIKKRKIRLKSLVRKGRRDVSSSYAEVRRMPGAGRSNVVTNIYGNKIALVIFSRTPQAILIENKEAADAYRSYFNFMWDKAEK